MSEEKIQELPKRVREDAFIVLKALKGSKPLSIKEIQHITKMSYTRVSKALVALEGIKLVKSEEIGGRIVYTKTVS
jgi:DNA-binding transcriptional regulator GbsR (MarR family)